MSKKQANQKQAQPNAPPTNAERQLAPVAVLTITYLPPLNQIANIQPHYPRTMSADDVLHVLQMAQRAIIENVTAQKLAQSQQAGPAA